MSCFVLGGIKVNPDYCLSVIVASVLLFCFEWLDERLNDGNYRARFARAGFLKPPKGGHRIYRGTIEKRTITIEDAGEYLQFSAMLAHDLPERSLRLYRDRSSPSAQTHSLLGLLYERGLLETEPELLIHEHRLSMSLSKADFDRTPLAELLDRFMHVLRCCELDDDGRLLRLTKNARVEDSAVHRDAIDLLMKARASTQVLELFADRDAPAESRLAAFCRAAKRNADTLAADGLWREGIGIPWKTRNTRAGRAKLFAMLLPVLKRDMFCAALGAQLLGALDMSDAKPALRSLAEQYQQSSPSLEEITSAAIRKLKEPVVGSSVQGRISLAEPRGGDLSMDSAGQLASLSAERKVS